VVGSIAVEQRIVVTIVWAKRTYELSTDDFGKAEKDDYKHRYPEACRHCFKECEHHDIFSSIYKAFRLVRPSRSRLLDSVVYRSAIHIAQQAMQRCGSCVVRVIVPALESDRMDNIIFRAEHAAAAPS
jgi:hypothetical protein